MLLHLLGFGLCLCTCQAAPGFIRRLKIGLNKTETPISKQCQDACPGLEALSKDMMQLSKRPETSEGEWCQMMLSHAETVSCGIVQNKICASESGALRSSEANCALIGIDIKIPDTKPSNYTMQTCRLCTGSWGAEGRKVFNEQSRSFCEQKCEEREACKAYDYDAMRKMCRTWAWCPESSLQDYGCHWTTYYRPGAFHSTSTTQPPPEQKGCQETHPEDGGCMACALQGILNQDPQICQECGTNSYCMNTSLLQCTAKCKEPYQPSRKVLHCLYGKWAPELYGCELVGEVSGGRRVHATALALPVSVSGFLYSMMVIQALHA